VSTGHFRNNRNIVLLVFTLGMVACTLIPTNAFAAKTSSYPQQTVCNSLTNVPQGWVIISNTYLSSCGGSSPNAWTIMNVSSAPLNTQVSICASPSAPAIVPIDWIVVQDTVSNPSACGAGPVWAYDAFVIKNEHNAPAAATATMCFSSQVAFPPPEGWFFRSYSTPSVCAALSADTTTAVSMVNLDGMALGTREPRICTIQQNWWYQYAWYSTSGNPSDYCSAGNPSLGYLSTFTNWFVDLRTGSGPYHIAAADLNHDGITDIVTSNWNDGTVSVLLGQSASTETFAFHFDYPVELNPAGLVLADVNGDGNLDIVVPNASSSSVSVLLGNGDGTFQPQVSYSVGLAPNGVTAVDLNHDGKLDLIAANYLDNSVSVLLGNGDGTFQPQQQYATGTNPHFVVAADFNGDGNPDIAVNNWGSNSVSIFPGNGDGTLGTRKDLVTGTSPGQLVAADFNGDGMIDIAVANHDSNSISVLTNRGSLRFVRGDYPTYNGPYSLATADLNGDGHPDLVTGEYGDSVNAQPDNFSVLLNSGTGVFLSHADYKVWADSQALALADINNDGALDVILGIGQSEDVFIVNGKGHGAFVRYPTNLVSIKVTPANSTVTAGTIVQFTATGTYKDGTTQDLTAQVYWASSSTSVAEIAPGGIATTYSAGKTGITATDPTSGLSGSTNLTVK